MIYLRGSTWYTDVQVPDPKHPDRTIRKRVSTGYGVQQKELAMVAAAKLAAGLPVERNESPRPSPAFVPASDELTLGEAFDRMKRTRWKGHATEKATGRIALEIERFFGPHVLLSSLTRESVRSLSSHWESQAGRKGRPRPSPQRIQRKLAVLSAALNEMAGEYGVKCNPRAVPPQKQAKVRLTYLDEAQFAELAKHEADPESRAMWSFLGEVGARFSEAIQLTWADVNLAARIVTLRNDDTRRTKNGNDRAVPLTAGAVAALRAVKGRPSPFGWMGYTGWAKRFKAACKRAGIVLPKGTALHAMRHTCGTLLIAKGADIREVQEWFGHSDIKTSARYAKAMPRRLRELANKVGNITE